MPDYLPDKSVDKNIFPEIWQQPEEKQIGYFHNIFDFIPE